MIRECGSLKENEQVVFNRYCNIFKDKVPETGSVVSVNLNNNTVCVSWLEGYKDRKDDVPFEDMLAVHNPEGEMMRFKNISGNSDKLVPFLEKTIEQKEEDIVDDLER